MPEISLLQMTSSDGLSKCHSEDGSDSDYSSESNPSTEQLLSTDRASPEKPLIKDKTYFNSATDASIPDLKDQVSKLSEITSNVGEVHRNATVRSLLGSVIAAAGGIIMIVGLILAPFTVGVSLIVTGLGVGTSAAGSLIRTASNIKELIKKKMSRKEIKTILDDIKMKLSPMTGNLHDIKLRINEIPRAKATDPSGREEQIAYAIGRWMGFAAEAIRLGLIFGLDTEGEYVSRAVIGTEVITGALAAIFLLMDLLYIGYYIKQLREINKERRRGNGKSAISKFMKGMKEIADLLNQVLDQLRSSSQSHTTYS